MLIKTKEAQIVQLSEKIERLEINVKSLEDKYNKVNSIENKVKETEEKVTTTLNGLDKMISLGFFKHYVEMGVPDKDAINNLNVKVGVVLKELGFNHACLGCGEVFKTEIQLRKHEKKHKEHECQICGEVFKTERQLKKHEQMCEEEE